MELKKVLVVVVMCLMVTGVYATNSWKATGGEIYWSQTSGWTNGLPADIEQIKLANNSGVYAACTLNSDAGTFTTNKVTIGGTANSGLWADSPQLFIVDGGVIGIGNEMQVGDSSSKRGRVTQTGGTVNLTGKLEVGYKSSAGYGGTYTISGGTIAGSNNGRLYVGGGGAAGSEGVLTIQGSAASINVAYLYVGCSTSTGTYAGKGTVAFEIVNGAVSAINAGSVYIDPINDAASITSLIVNGTGSAPTSNIVLVNNTGTNSVTGIFDGAAEGTIFNVNGVNMTLSYVYAAGADKIGNDIALVIPEPITLALLGLGLVAVRRK